MQHFIEDPLFVVGMDRLCGCTQQGKLYFYLIGPRTSELTDSEVLQQAVMVRHGTSGGKEQDTAHPSTQEPMGRLATGTDIEQYG